MPPLPAAIILRLAPVAPLVSRRVWGQAHALLLGASLPPGARPVATAWRVMGLRGERPVTNDPRVWNRAPGSALQARRMLVGWRGARVLPPGPPMVLGADATLERRRGRQIAAPGGSRAAVRSTQPPVIRGCGLPWVVLRRWVPVPWARRVWA